MKLYGSFRSSAAYRVRIALNLKGLSADLIPVHLRKGEQTAGGFCLGSTPSLADLCLVPQVYNAERMGCPLDDYPIIRGVVEQCRALSAFADAAPERQPDCDL